MVQLEEYETDPWIYNQLRQNLSIYSSRLVLIWKTGRSVFASQLVQNAYINQKKKKNNQSSNFGLIEEIMDLSCILSAVSLEANHRSTL